MLDVLFRFLALGFPHQTQASCATKTHGPQPKCDLGQMPAGRHKAPDVSEIECVEV